MSSRISRRGCSWRGCSRHSLCPSFDWKADLPRFHPSALQPTCNTYKCFLTLKPFLRILYFFLLALFHCVLVRFAISFSLYALYKKNASFVFVISSFLPLILAPPFFTSVIKPSAAFAETSYRSILRDSLSMIGHRLCRRVINFCPELQMSSQSRNFHPRLFKNGNFDAYTKSTVVWDLSLGLETRTFERADRVVGYKKDFSKGI